MFNCRSFGSQVLEEFNLEASQVWNVSKVRRVHAVKQQKIDAFLMKMYHDAAGMLPNKLLAHSSSCLSQRHSTNCNDA